MDGGGAAETVVAELGEGGSVVLFAKEMRKYGPQPVPVFGLL
jgi:hypothetical protein